MNPSGNAVVTLSEQDVLELKAIVMDEDGKQALSFLKSKVLSRVLRRENSRLNVDGKTHL
jgi:hypothetical protein